MPLSPKPLHVWCEEIDKLAPPLWVLENIIQSDAAVLVSGAATRSYKTWFAFQAGLCVASGTPCALLNPIEHGPVLVIEQEGPAVPTRQRFSKLENGSGISVREIGDRFWFSHRQQTFVDNDDDMKQVAQFAKDRELRLVVLDTLAKLTRGDENSAKDIGFAMRGIDKIRNATQGRTAVMYLHHLRKPPQEKNSHIDIDDEIRGSSALAGFYDVHLAFRQRFEGQPHLDLTVRGNQLPEAYYSVQWFIEPERAKLKMEKVAAGSIADTFKDYCVALLFPERAYSQSDLQRVWGVASRNAVKDLIDVLLEDGTIEKSGRSYRLSA